MSLKIWLIVGWIQMDIRNGNKWIEICGNEGNGAGPVVRPPGSRVPPLPLSLVRRGSKAQIGRSSTPRPVYPCAPGYLAKNMGITETQPPQKFLGIMQLNYFKQILSLINRPLWGLFRKYLFVKSTQFFASVCQLVSIVYTPKENALPKKKLPKHREMQ